MMRLGLLLVALSLMAPVVRADTLVAGRIVDSFGAPVSGAAVSARDGGVVLDDRLTADDGRFNLSVSYGDFGSIALRVEKDGYVTEDQDVSIVNGSPDRSAYEIQIMSTMLASCGAKRGAVIVGHFRPPAGQTVSELNSRIVEVLQFKILPQLQSVGLDGQLGDRYAELRPRFTNCEQIKLASPDQSKTLARRFEAQAFISGAVRPATQGFDVATYVTDAQQVFASPFSTTSRNVDLDIPPEAAIHPHARTAIYLSIMANLEQADRCEAVIYVGQLADTALLEDQASPATDAADFLRDRVAGITSRCRQNLPHVGLIEGGLPQ